MTTSLAIVKDLDWIVAVLVRRREPLVRHAPIFWQPAPDAEVNHRVFIAYLLTDGGARAYRTDSSILIAVPRGGGWLVDDASIQGERWAAGDGRELWTPLMPTSMGEDVRLVCPIYERDRRRSG